MKKGALASLVVLATCSANAAEPDEGGWYGRLTSGYSWASGDVDLLGPTQSVYGGSPGFDMHGGGSFSLALGRRLPMGWRLEAELGLLVSDTDRDRVNGVEQRVDDTFRLDGEVESAVFMVNGLFDFDVDNELFTPYLKAGLGLARNEAEATLDVDYGSAIWTGTPFEGASTVGEPFPRTWETSFAWNVGLGLRTELSDRFLLTLEYGFIDLGEAETGLDEAGDAVVFDRLSAQRFLLGLDFRF